MEFWDCYQNHTPIILFFNKRFTLSYNKNLSTSTMINRGPSAVRGVVQCGHFTDKGVLQMRTFALFGAKTFKFFEIYGVFARTGEGLNQCRYISDKGGQFIAILCGRPLRTVPYNFVTLKSTKFLLRLPIGDFLLHSVKLKIF